MRLSPSRVFVVVSLLVSMAACGGGSSSAPGGSSSSSSTETQSGGSLEEYASGLCTAVGDWVDALQTESTTFQEAASNIASPEDIGNVKEALVTYAGNLVDETDALIAEVDSIGAPDVANGDEVFDGLKQGFKRARDLFAQLEESAKGLSADDPTAMASSMMDMASGLQDGAMKIQDAFASIDDSELKGLSESVPACRSLPSP